jgi:hypothetical protein
MLGSAVDWDRWSERKFRANFGIGVETVQLLLSCIFEDDQLPVHYFLWTLFWLKTYDTYDVCSAFFGVDPKTFQRHIMATVHFLYNTLHTVCYLINVCWLIFFPINFRVAVCRALTLLFQYNNRLSHLDDSSMVIGVESII